MLARITWDGAARSYTILGKSFKKGEPKSVQDPDLVKACRRTGGFVVEVLEKAIKPVAKPEPEPKEDEVAATVEADESEGEQ